MTIKTAAGRLAFWKATSLPSAMLLLGLGIAGTASANTCGAGNETADGDQSLACGDGTPVYGDQSVAVGVFAGTGTEELPSNFNTAVGYFARASGESLALGARSAAGGSYQIDPSVAHTAVGTGAEAGIGLNGLHHSTAMGYGAKANTTNAIALGANAQANFEGSTAIGVGVATTRDNQVAIGLATSTYTLAGINSAASKAAQSGTAYMVTSDANGNLATSTFDLATLEGLPTRVGTLETTVANHETRIFNTEQTVGTHTLQITNLDNRVTTNTQNIAILDNRVTNLEAGFQDLGNQIGENLSESRGGTALALSAASLRYDDRPEKLSIAGGVGHFKGLTGLSFGVGYATSESLRFNAAVSGVPENGDVGFSAGASWTLN